MDWKKIGKKLLFPPIWVMLLLVIFSAAALVLIFLKGLEETPIAYVLYVTAFYTLSVVCVFCWKVFPRQYGKIKQSIYAHPIGKRYLTDMAFRTNVSLHVSLGINMLYVGVNVLSYVWYDTMWFVVLAVYYFILSVMRFLLVQYAHKKGIGKNRLGELKRSRLCAMILLTVNFALSGAVLMILYQNKGFQYHGILIYVMAAYTFYTTIHAIVNLVKYRKYKSPIMTTTKMIALSAALVSMLSLETAMFSQFGQDMLWEHQWIMIALTGAGVSLVVVGMSLFVILKSGKEIKQWKE